LLSSKLNSHNFFVILSIPSICHLILNHFSNLLILSNSLSFTFFAFATISVSSSKSVNGNHLLFNVSCILIFSNLSSSDFFEAFSEAIFVS
jgi:hypothetical protein